MVARRGTRTGGRPATEGVIRGRYALSVGDPGTPTPESWSWRRLTDLARLESGHTPSRKHPEYWDGDIPWIGIRDATSNHGRTLTQTEQYTNQLGIDNSSARLLPPNTVCLSRTASVGYVVVTGTEMATSQDFVNWVCGDELDYRFLKYVLLAENDTYLSFAGGTTHQTIYFPEVKAFHICTPPLAAQRRIADTLSAYDDLIENNRRRVEILEAMARLIYREWFVHFRFPGHEGVQLVDSDLGPIPAGWSVVPFSELADFVNGFAFKPAHWRDEGLPIVKIKELKNGVTADSPRYHGEDIKEKYFIEDGDLLFSWSAHLDAYIWSHGPALLNQHLFVVRPYDVSQLFMFHSLKARMEDFRARAQGTTMHHIKRSALREVSTVVPDDETRKSFERAVAPMLQLQLNLVAQNRVLNEARDLLLPRLVSGELDVSKLALDLAEAG